MPLSNVNREEDVIFMIVVMGARIDTVSSWAHPNFEHLAYAYISMHVLAKDIVVA